MIGLQDLTLFGVLVLVFDWLTGSILVAGLTRGGIFAYFGWLLAALVCSPLFVALYLIGISVQRLEDRLVEELGSLRDVAQGPPTRFQQRFGGGAAEKGDED
jgi:hypothetical protein